MQRVCGDALNGSKRPGGALRLHVHCHVFGGGLSFCFLVFGACTGCDHQFNACTCQKCCNETLLRCSTRNGFTPTRHNVHRLSRECAICTLRDLREGCL